MTLKDLKPGDKFMLPDPDNKHIFKVVGPLRPLSKFHPDWLYVDIETDWGPIWGWPADREILPFQLSMF